MQKKDNKPFLESVQILENKEIKPGYYCIKFALPETARTMYPGQFFDVRVDNRIDMVLRRPFSVFDVDSGSVCLLYEVVGKGTEILSKRQPGEELDVLGPLGNGFTLPDKGFSALLIGGGIGIAPLYYLARILKQRDIKIDLLIGAKDKYSLLCIENFNDLGVAPDIATDDGSRGYKGFVTELLEKKTDEVASDKMIVYACGPNVMLKKIDGYAQDKNIKAQLSLERHMGCGMGACLGCVVKAVSGSYKKVCKDGPVFTAGELLWK